MPLTRQLAAIMFTDIVGYTALMGADEQKAFEILAKNRELQKPIIEKYNGRWIKELGDGVMASFNTVTDAVYAAEEIQEKCNALGEFLLRIGIHQGEIVFENDDVFGDAVNVASRIQALAPVGGIWVSETIHHNVSNKKGISTKYIKHDTLKNVKEPISIYEIIVEQAVQPFASDTIENTNLQEKSIAVLPFVNMSPDPEQEYFCDGIAEEIINALTSINNLRVVARTSAFTFKGKNIDIREIGKILDVNTLLEGSVRKAGNRLRITTQLVRVSDGFHVWSHRYDRVLEDIFAIQEDIAQNVATALQGYLTGQEKQSIRRQETNIEAYEYYLKGRQQLHRLILDEAKSFFEKTIKLDAEYAPAYAGLAYLHSWLYEWAGANDSDLVAAEKNSQKALSLAPTLSESHSSRGYVLSLARRYDEAEEAFKHAILLNPNSYDAYYLYGRSSFANGKIEKSAELFRKAAEVNKEDFQSMLIYGFALKKLGKKYIDITREGIMRAKKHLQLNPFDRRALSLGGVNLLDLGEKEEALKWTIRALELYPDDAGVLINAMSLFAKSGEKEKALEILKKIFEKGYGKKDWIEHDPDYDSLRNEPGFKALLNKLK